MLLQAVMAGDLVAEQQVFLLRAVADVVDRTSKEKDGWGRGRRLERGRLRRAGLFALGVIPDVESLAALEVLGTAQADSKQKTDEIPEGVSAGFAS